MRLRLEGRDLDPLEVHLACVPFAFEAPEGQRQRAGVWRGGRSSGCRAGPRRRRRLRLPLDRPVHPALRPLLDGVDQLVREQLPTLRRVGLVAARAEEDVLAVGERPRAEVGGGRGGASVVVDLHAAEIRAQERLEVAAGLARQRSPAAAGDA
jgi:hypothetical protein